MSARLKTQSSFSRAIAKWAGLWKTPRLAERVWRSASRNAGKHLMEARKRVFQRCNPETPPPPVIPLARVLKIPLRSANFVTDPKNTRSTGATVSRR